MTEKNCTNCKYSACICGGWWCEYSYMSMTVMPDYCCEHWEAME